MISIGKNSIKSSLSHWLKPATSAAEFDLKIFTHGHPAERAEGERKSPSRAALTNSVASDLVNVFDNKDLLGIWPGHAHRRY
jgi:hypothetical protein